MENRSDVTYRICGDLKEVRYQKALKTLKIQQKTAIFRDRCNNLRTFRYIYTRKLKAPVGLIIM